MINLIDFKTKLESLTSKWWLYLILGFLFFLPSCSAIKYPTTEIPKVIVEVLKNPIIYSYPIIFPVLKILMLIMVLGIFLSNIRINRIFAFFISVLLLAVSLFQNSAFTNNYGFVLLTGSCILQLVVAISWLWEVLSPENVYPKPKDFQWKWILVPLVFLSYWFPMDNSANPDFSITSLFTNGAMLTYCMVTPILLFLLIAAYPRVNVVTFRITRFVGLLFGGMNMINWFILNREFWWLGVLHLPLFLLAILALFLKTKNMEKDRIGQGKILDESRRKIFREAC
jgi:hypothetical protein